MMRYLVVLGMLVFSKSTLWADDTANWRSFAGLAPAG